MDAYDQDIWWCGTVLRVDPEEAAVEVLLSGGAHMHAERADAGSSEGFAALA